MIFIPSVLAIAILTACYLKFLLLRYPVTLHYRSAVTAWMAVGALSVFLSLDSSRFLWERLWEFAPRVMFPWRMQLGTNLAILVLCLILYSVQDAKARRVWRGNLLVTMGIMLMSFQTYRITNLYVNCPRLQELILSQNYLISLEYRTEWETTKRCRIVDLYNLQEDYGWFKRCTEQPRLLEVPPEVMVKIEEWGNGRIGLEVSSPKPASLTLRQLYFPTWKLEAPAGVSIEPNAVDGRIQLSLPALQRQKVLLRQEVALASPWARFAYIVSIVAALLLLGLGWMAKNASGRASGKGIPSVA
jgi:hypothetical protein